MAASEQSPVDAVTAEGDASSLRAALKLVFFLTLIAVFFLPVWLAHSLRCSRLRSACLRLFYRLAAWGWAVRIEVEGTPSRQRPLLWVSNHCSYLDIPVLGSFVAVRFTPKLDVRGWPLIGYLCCLAGCVFIDRRRSQTKSNQQDLQQALAEGHVISLFPEGTTNDGTQVQPFRSSYFSLAEMQIGNHQPVGIQLVTVAYSRYNGQPLSRAEMDKVAWYGDAEFVPHLWDYFKTRGAIARLVFHPVVTAEGFADRKALAAYCESQIRDTFEA